MDQERLVYPGPARRLARESIAWGVLGLIFWGYGMLWASIGLIQGVRSFRKGGGRLAIGGVALCVAALVVSVTVYVLKMQHVSAR